SDRIGERNDALGLANDRVVDEDAVDGDRRRAGPLGLAERRNDLPRKGDLVRVRRVDAVHHRDLVGMDADASAMAERARDEAILLQRGLVAELEERAVE